MNRTFTRFSAFAGVGIAAAALSACSSDSGAENSQVVARVDGAEITVSQLHNALQAKGEVEPSAEATRAALEGLVNQQLLVDAALRNELDRDPTVMQAMESARRQLLARAYLERIVFPQAEISAAEQTDYYKANPALFAQRRIYQMTNFTVPSAAIDEAVIKELDEASTVDDVAAVLAARGVEHEAQIATRAPEQLPLEQLPQFASVEVGDVLIQPGQDERTTLMLITDIQPSPLGFETAQPIVQQYLANIRNAEALDTHLKEARATASITHVDPSLGTVTATEPSAAPEIEAQASGLQDGAPLLK